MRPSARAMIGVRRMQIEMSLPDLIEIVPLSAAPEVEITVPGSKSITNRALILAALAEGEVTLEGALWSEDTQVMVEALQKLGYSIEVQPHLGEAANRTIHVAGLGQAIPSGGTEEKPLELFVGNAGTAARFLTAFLCLAGASTDSQACYACMSAHRLPCCRHCGSWVIESTQKTTGCR